MQVSLGQFIAGINHACILRTIYNREKSMIMDKEKRIGVYGVQLYEQNVMPFIQILKSKAHLICFSGTSSNTDTTDEIIGQYELVNLFLHIDICALVIMPETIRNETVIQKLVEVGKKKKIPVFSLDRKVDGCYNLIMNNDDCFEQIMRHIVQDHGCRHINMIAGDKGNSFSEARIDIYRKVLAENNIPIEEERIGYGNFWECPVTGVIEQFFKSDLPFPDAIVCANDIMAHAAITCLNKYGLEVPEDLLVTGYDGTKDGINFLPSITTGKPDYEKTINEILTEIDLFLNSNQISPRDIDVPVIMDKRQSCGCKKKRISKNDRRISNYLAEIGNGKWHMKCMNLMLSDTFAMQKIEDIFPIIQKHMDVWFRFLRFIYLKSDLLKTYDVCEYDTAMTTILEANRGNFSEIGTEFDIRDLQTLVNQILKDESFQTILVHPLISGKDVYGFSIEGFEEMIDWQIKHSDEFSMFLSHILHAVVHNHKMHILNEEMATLSTHDQLTGLYNRRGFFQKMNEFISLKENNGKYLYLFMIDMDGLKYINDNFGHGEGDFALSALANALKNMSEDEIICARIGGDEFICSFIDEATGKYSSEAFGQQMDAVLKNVKDTSGKTYPIAASVGMMKAEITENLDLDSIINRADSKMYRNKIARKKKEIIP